MLDATTGLLIGRSQDDPRMGGVEPETLGRQRADLLGTEPRRQREPVGHRPIRPAHSVALRSPIRGFDEESQLGIGEVPAGVPDVFLGVVAGHAQHRIIEQAAVGPCPSDEGPDASPMMVDRLQAQSLVLQPGEGVLDLGGLQLIKSRRTGQACHSGGPVLREVGMLDRPSPRDHRPMPISQVIADEPASLGLAADRRGVDQSGLDLGRPGFRRAGYLLRRPPIRATFPFPLHSLGVGESKVPDFPFFA